MNPLWYFAGAFVAFGLVAFTVRPDHPWDEWLGSLRRRPAGWILAGWVVLAGLAAGYFFEAGGALLAGEDMLAAAAAVAVAGFVLFLLFYWEISAMKKNPMPSYLQLIGGGGVAEVRARLDADPAKAPLQIIVPPDLAAQLKHQVLGQEIALDELAEGVIRRARLRRKNKPIFVALLVGATGAGKTETAKALAQALGSEQRAAPLIRIDCAELSSDQGVQRLIGAPPGYVGSDQGGQLTNAIKRERGGVILFDEIEKAHEKVLLTLMALLDEARLTDQSSGDTADASGFVLLFTSNAEHEAIAAIAASTPPGPDRTRALKDILGRLWRPEQLSRFDAILAFQPLPFQARCELIAKVIWGFAEEAGVEIVPDGLDPAAIADAIRKGVALEKYGVRELHRALERELMDGLLLAREQGAKYVRIEADADGLRVVALPIPASVR